ncbi:FHA domain-containing protein [Streptomyces sp. NA04227]|uniref:FHA domain-containing protein n=1 Tax=Streptomyces sp. NA04227 TaxID=2742136 RepID=UPI001591079C|nr:FHA domain-containing protein [Streptomyces sp. NA04227]QKW06258.1 FHA domain-containing protein [Streptomyces sp. NA04227]
MLELTMATVADDQGAGAGATAGMQMAEAPSSPGAVLRVGRDRAQCRLVTPDDWLFVSRVHLEFVCGPSGAWTVHWLRGSHAEPSSRVRLLTGGTAHDLDYGSVTPLPHGGSGELIVEDRSAPRTVNVGFYHEP